MLTPKFIRENKEKVSENLRKRFSPVSLEDFEAFEKKRLEFLQEGEALKAFRNEASKEIGVLKKNGQDASGKLKEMKQVSDRIKAIDHEISSVEENVLNFCLSLPNMIDEDVPVGKDESFNKEVRRVGTPPVFDFSPLDHGELAQRLDIIDFKRGTKIAGARFSVLKNDGAALERALFNFMLQENKSRGYTEVIPPVINNRESLIGTGQLPKFEEDLFKVDGWDGRYYLIPTAEVPLTNLHRGEILNEQDLPLKYTALTSCFRSEAGSAGRDTRGIIRQHQFNKVEIVKICRPEDSHKEHETLISDAENILQKLGLHYRVTLLASGDTGFSAAKCYDLEVWLPSRNDFVEISSCSNFKDFQGQRAAIRYKDPGSGKNRTVHTLNGSSLAVGRTMVAILENYQMQDGSVSIPSVLKPFMGKDKIS